jgi:hypothetical protein
MNNFSNNQRNNPITLQKLFEEIISASQYNKVKFSKILSRKTTEISESELMTIKDNIVSVLTAPIGQEFKKIIASSNVFTLMLLENDKLSNEERKWYFALDKKRIVNAYKMILSNQTRELFPTVNVLKVLILSIKYFNADERKEIYEIIKSTFWRLIGLYTMDAISIETILSIFSLLKENKYDMSYFETIKHYFIENVTVRSLKNVTIEQFKQSMTMRPKDYSCLFDKYQKYVLNYHYTDLHIHSLMMCLKYLDDVSSEDRKVFTDFLENKYQYALNNETVEKNLYKDAHLSDYFKNKLNEEMTNQLNTANRKEYDFDRIMKILFNSIYQNYINILFANVSDAYLINNDNKKYVYLSEPKNAIKKYDIIKEQVNSLTEEMFKNNIDTFLKQNTQTFNKIQEKVQQKENFNIPQTLIQEILKLYDLGNWELFISLMSICTKELYKNRVNSGNLPKVQKIKNNLKEDISMFSKEDRERFYKKENFIITLNTSVENVLVKNIYNKETATLLLMYFCFLWEL